MSSTMASVEQHTFAMLPRHVSEEHDLHSSMYPDPPHGAFTNAPLDLGLTSDAYYPRMSQDLPTTMSGFENIPFAIEGPAGWSYGGMSPPTFPDDRDMGIASNMSTGSGPSAPSSAVGSPRSTQGHPAPIPEWAPQGLAMSPGIVGSHEYITGTEYSFAPPGMEDLAPFAYADTSKPHGFVGELPQTSTSAAAHHSQQQQQHHQSYGPVSPCVSRRESSCTLVSQSGLGGDTPSEIGCAQIVRSPISPQPSRKPSNHTSPDLSNPLPSPTAAGWASPTTPHVSPFFSQSSGHFIAPLGSSYPSLIHPEMSRPLISPYEGGFPQPAPAYPNSPALTSSSPHMRNGSQSPFLPPTANYHYSPYPIPVDQARRPSLVSFHSGHSGAYSDSDSKEKQRCPHPECGKVFKDLKAHMLTHQTERPEKCPITTCEYHIKGFARKYDKNRHTLTHYKGTMVCGFCPGSGSAAEKSFNRADVFKRHLTAVHGVEQTPPNSRKNKNGAGAVPAGAGKKPGPGYAPDATGKCSTCSQTFSNAQDFYEHLDDCVLRIVQQEDPAEAVNARRLAEVENDREVHQTLEKNNLPTATQTMPADDEEDDEEMDDEEGLSFDEQELVAMGLKTSASPIKRKGNPASGVQKSRGLTHSRGGVPKPNTPNKGRKNRREYPSSWGFDKGQMTMKKRVMAVFDGPRRLAKDDMMLSTEHEVRLPLADGKSYVTDLDVQTLRRAEGFLNATDEEKGIWISDDPTEEEYKAMLDAQLQ